jgi:hypothetical protein
MKPPRLVTPPFSHRTRFHFQNRIRRAGSNIIASVPYPLHKGSRIVSICACSSIRYFRHNIPRESDSKGHAGRQHCTCVCRMEITVFSIQSTERGYSFTLVGIILFWKRAVTISYHKMRVYTTMVATAPKATIQTQPLAPSNRE